MRVEFVSNKGAVLGWVDDLGGADGLGVAMLTSPLVSGLDHHGKVARYASGWSNGYVHTRTVSTVEKRKPYRYEHGWKLLADVLYDHDRDYTHQRVTSSVRADGSVSLYVEGGQHEDDIDLQVEDIPALVAALDTHLTAHEADTVDDVTGVPIGSGGTVEISSPTRDRIDLDFETRAGHTATVSLAPDEVDQFTADLDDLVREHRPELVETVDVSGGLALDLYSHDRVGIRPADGETVVLSRSEVDDVAAALSKLDSRYGGGGQEWDEHGRPLHVDDRDIPGGLIVRWYSDNSAGVIRGDDEATIPPGQTQATVAGFGRLFAVPQLTPKGERLVRLLAKQAGADAVTKFREGTPAGRHRARHLIRWYNQGAEGQIPWGAPGDFAACVRVAGEHIKDPEGFCNLRHKDALGIYPATHAARERKGGKGKGAR